LRIAAHTDMATKLDQILAHTKQTVEARKRSADAGLLAHRASLHQPRGFAANLRRVATDRPAVIAELKKASPSKGLIRAEFDPVALALTLERGGAAALSVLTNEHFFQGSLLNLELASAAVKLPCLRKDFMVDPFQMLEARASGADAILLIVAAHTDADLGALRASAGEAGLDVLCEVHDREELVRAIALGCEAIGVNCRDLRDFTVHPERLLELAELIPADVVRVAESGIQSGEDMARLRAAGYDAFLIGESLMRQPDPGEALAEMLGHSMARTGA
jgi:indole-3-glycerol phosphate synthase